MQGVSDDVGGCHRNILRDRGPPYAMTSREDHATVDGSPEMMTPSLAGLIMSEVKSYMSSSSVVCPEASRTRTIRRHEFERWALGRERYNLRYQTSQSYTIIRELIHASHKSKVVPRMVDVRLKHALIDLSTQPAFRPSSSPSSATNSSGQIA